MLNYDYLEQKRKLHQYTYEEISNYLGYSSPATGWKLIHGALRLKAIHLKMLADLYGTTVNEFFINGPKNGGDQE